MLSALITSQLCIILYIFHVFFREAAKPTQRGPLGQADFGLLMLVGGKADEERKGREKEKKGRHSTSYAAISRLTARNST